MVSNALPCSEFRHGLLRAVKRSENNSTGGMRSGSPGMMAEEVIWLFLLAAFAQDADQRYLTAGLAVRSVPSSCYACSLYTEQHLRFPDDSDLKIFGAFPSLWRSG